MSPERNSLQWFIKRLTRPNEDDKKKTKYSIVKVTWQVTKDGNPYSEFVLCIYSIQSAHTQEWTHTHREHTPGAVCSLFYAAAPGEQLGVRCLAQGHLSRGIEGGESAVHSLPPPTIPAGPETGTRDLWVTSPTL